MTSTATPAAGDRAGRIAAVGYDPTAGPLGRAGACNLCGAAERVEVSRRDRYGYAVTLVACGRCGLAFLDPRPSAAAYAAFYRDVYRPLVSAYHGRRIDAETVQADQRGYAAELHGFLRRALGAPPEAVLDIGGSTGVVGSSFRADGATVTVLDPAPAELAVAAAAGMETIEGFAEDFDPGGRRWDLVLLCQTVDHLLDVRATLEAIRRLLAPGGHAFVDVLDVTWVLEREGEIERAVKVDHPFYLTRSTALALFARAGLRARAERMADDGHWGFLLAAAPPDAAALPPPGAAGELLREVWRRRAASR